MDMRRYNRVRPGRQPAQARRRKGKETSDTGGYAIAADIKRDYNRIQCDITCTWNDIMDPNFKYDSDKKKAEIAEIIPYATLSLMSHPAHGETNIPNIYPERSS